ncbi:hypothetical protein [Umezawaea tangerina]|uniref:hypothetical protein n=1 Tax=Umezawaea tangerina TaxID=84725 RepID=UPI0011B24154|nr:hypothetical protein [Umezawaea tangerina]
MGHRELPRSGRGCFGLAVALPLAAVGLAGVLALLVLRGEQPGDQAVGQPLQGTSRPTPVSARHPEVAVTPSSVPPVADEDVVRLPDVPANVRRVPAQAVQALPEAPPSVQPSTVERRDRREPRSHRTKPGWSVTLLPSATPTTKPQEPTATPTQEPTQEPTREPTGHPTGHPTKPPTGQPGTGDTVQPVPVDPTTIEPVPTDDPTPPPAPVEPADG